MGMGWQRVLACGCWVVATAGPSPDVKAGNSWHKEPWLPRGGTAGFLAVGAVLGVGLVGGGWGDWRDPTGRGNFRRD